MSVCVNVRTEKQLDPNDIFRNLADSGERIIVTSDKFPHVHLGTHLKSLRGIEINQEEGGYEVRVCSFSSLDDLRLFAKTIQVVIDMTGGKAYFEDADDEEVTDPLQQFDEKWAKTQRASSFEVIRALSTHSGYPIVMYGIFLSFCIGPKLLEAFHIPLRGAYRQEDVAELQDYLIDVQWKLADEPDTSTRLAISPPSGKEEERQDISLISIKNGKVSQFTYISEAQLLGLMDMDDKSREPVFIPFREADKILPGDLFEPIDDEQYRLTGKLSADTVHEMMERARYLQPDDLFGKDTFPGEGRDRQQHTVILMWNPAISSVSLKDHRRDIAQMRTADFCWSVWEYDRARLGDQFYLVKVGEGHTGIVMSGVFISHPFQGEDWSGKGRLTYYAHLRPNVILDPDSAPMVTTAQLAKAIPSFDWSGGHSGRLLTSDEALRLESLWADYLKHNKNKADGRTLDIISGGSF